jgi:hypothetical protein
MNETEQAESPREVLSGRVDQVTGKDVTFEKGITRMASAEGNLTFTNSLAGSINAGGDITLANAGAGALVAGRDMMITKGAGFALVAGGNVNLDRGLVRVAVVGNDVRLDRSMIGVIIGRGNGRVVGDNNRLLLNRPLAILCGAAFGAAMALTTWLLWREK